MQISKANIIAMAALLILLCVVLPAKAEYYKYRDAKGNTHFTDNILEVPEAQRDQIAKYREYKETPAPASASPPAVKPSADTPAPGKVVSDDPKVIEGQRLQSLRQKLIQEYDTLLKEKERLVAESKRNMTNMTVKRKIQNNIEALNKKIQAYDKKSKQFEKDLEAYNASVLK